jgi:RNA polymerase sigma-B factor
MHTPIAQELKTESLELLRAYYQSPSAELRNRVVELNLGLVRKEAHHWVNQCTESYDDLMQVGSMGLLRAIERFDIAKGHAFSSFAVPYIRGEIQHYLRDKGSPVRIPRRWQTIQHQAATLTAQLRNQLNRQPTDAEVAGALQISLAELQEVKLAFRNRAPLSLDAPISDDDDGSVSLAELMPDNRYQSFQLAQEDQIRLQQALVQLEQRTRDVLEFVFLYDLTQKETAERLGISSITVSRRVKSGLKLLRQMMIAPTS